MNSAASAPLRPLKGFPLDAGARKSSELDTDVRTFGSADAFKTSGGANFGSCYARRARPFLHPAPARATCRPQGPSPSPGPVRSSSPIEFVGIAAAAEGATAFG